MTAPSAAPRPKKPAPARRAWNRRPPSRRPDLTPEEVATMEEAQQRQRRTKALHVQLTPDEREQLEKRAERYGRSLSDFVRIVLLSDLKEPAPPALDREVGLALAYQLSKIGGNLNQLAKYANERRAAPAAADIREVIEQIKGTLSRIAT